MRDWLGTARDWLGTEVWGTDTVRFDWIFWGIYTLWVLHHFFWPERPGKRSR